MAKKPEDLRRLTRLHPHLSAVEVEARGTLFVPELSPVVDVRGTLMTRPWLDWARRLTLLVDGIISSGSGGGGGGGGGSTGPGYWTPITNGDPLSPEILFDAVGDCVVGFVPIPGA